MSGVLLARLAAALLAFPPAATDSAAVGGVEHQEETRIEAILAEEGVQTELRPSLSEYLGDARRRLFGRVLDEVAGIGWLEKAATVFLWTLEIGAALAIVVLLVILVRRWPARRARAQQKLDADTIELVPEDDAETAAGLRERIDALIGAGRTEEALSLLWRFVAARLRSSGVGAFPVEKTNRECARAVRSQRPDWERQERLDSFVAAIDRCLYAGVDPGETELRAIVATADELVA